MKPLMLIPPAQAEALSDARQERQTAPWLDSLPWLDDEAPEEAGTATKAAASEAREADHIRLRAA